MSPKESHTPLQEIKESRNIQLDNDSINKFLQENISPKEPRTPLQEIKESRNIQLDNDSIKEFLQGNTFNNCNITFNV